MNIIINGLPAAFKADLNFTYTIENTAATGGSSFTLEIPLPLDRPENARIFGPVDRLDIAKPDISLPAEIIAPPLHLHGMVIITSVTEAEVRVQFVEIPEGKELDDLLRSVYINKLDIPTPAAMGEPFYYRNYNPSSSFNPPAVASDYFFADYRPRSAYPSLNDSDYVSNYAGVHTLAKTWRKHRQAFQALPWINSDTGNMQNRYNIAFRNNAQNPSDPYCSADYDTATACSANPTWNGVALCDLCYQMYLSPLLIACLNAVGYTLDTSAIDSTPWGDLLVCNSVPASWDSSNYALGLPRWTVRRLLDEVEMLLKGRFVFDRNTHTARFRFRADMEAETPAVVIPNPVAAYEARRVSLKDFPHPDIAGIKYAERKDDEWLTLCCPAYVQAVENGIVPFASVIEGNYDTVNIPSSVTVVSADHITREERNIYRITLPDGTVRDYCLLRTHVTTDGNGTHIFFTVSPLNTCAPQTDFARECSIVPAPLVFPENNTDAQFLGHVISIPCGDDTENTPSLSGSSGVSRKDSPYSLLLAPISDTSGDSPALHSVLYVGFYYPLLSPLTTPLYPSVCTHSFRPVIVNDRWTFTDNDIVYGIGIGGMTVDPDTGDIINTDTGTALTNIDNPTGAVILPDPGISALSLSDTPGVSGDGGSASSDTPGVSGNGGSASLVLVSRLCNSGDAITASPSGDTPAFRHTVQFLLTGARSSSPASALSSSGARGISREDVSSLSGSRSVSREDVHPLALSSVVPDIIRQVASGNSLYIIRNAPFLCEKLELSFSDSGLSPLVQGTFFPLCQVLPA